MPFVKDAWGSSQYERNLQMGFNIGGPSLVDIRLVLSKEMMENADDSVMPPKYFALCKENNQIYYYDKSLKSIKDDPKELAIGKFRKINVQLADIQDQHGLSLIDNDDQIARIYIARKLSDLINDHDDSGNIFITTANSWDEVKKLSDSEQGIFSQVATTGEYDDLLNKPFIPDDAIYVDYYDDISVFDKLNGGTGEHHIKVKDALDAIAKAFTEDDVLPFIIETDSEDGTKRRHVAEKLEYADVPFIAFRLNLSDIYNDADFITKLYVDSENTKQNIEIVKKQNKLKAGANSRISFTDDSEDKVRVDTWFEDVAYSGSYKDLIDADKPYIYTKDNHYYMLDGGFVDSDGNPLNNLTTWLQDMDIKEYSPEYERLRVEVDSEGGILNRLIHVEDVDLPSKQDNLVAGKNITINSDGVTINAKDTLYTGGINVELSVDSEGKLTVINAKDSRYFAGDNITIEQDALDPEDSEGKRYIITARDSKYSPGFAIEINSEYGVQDGYIINVLYDGDTIVLDPITGKLRANTAGQIGVKLPITAQKVSDSESILTLDYDSETLIYDGHLKVHFDGETIHYASDGGLYVPIDGSTLVYDGNVIKTSLHADGKSILIKPDNEISVKLKPTASGKQTIYADEYGLYLKLNSGSLYVNSAGELVATGEVLLSGSNGINITQPGTGGYNVGLNIDNTTLIVDGSNVLKGNYQGANGINITGTTVKHTNSVVAKSDVGGNIDATTGEVTIPRVSFDSEGHIKSAVESVVYPPTTQGNENQYYMSTGSGTSGEWHSFDSAAHEDSEGGISSGAVYNELQLKQDVLTAGSYINIDQSTATISSTINSSEDSVIIITPTGGLDVDVDGVSIFKRDGKLEAASNLPILYTLTLPTSWEGPLYDLSNRAYYRCTVQELVGSSGNVQVATAITNDKIPFLTLKDTAGTTSIEGYIQWSKIYHTDVINDSGVKKLEFLAYEVPTSVINLNCTVFTASPSA